VRGIGIAGVFPFRSKQNPFILMPVSATDLSNLVAPSPS
jgi:hypothetical protein